MKKKYFLLSFIFLNSFLIFSNDNFIFTKKGIKIEINPNFLSIDSDEKIVHYKLLNSTVESSIGFRDFDYLVVKKNKFKTFKLNNSGEVAGYFVLCETGSKTLIISTKSDEDVPDKVFYSLYIIDSNNTVLESQQFDNLKNSKSASVRADISPKIKFYFEDCSSLIERVHSYELILSENFNIDILGFFNSPVYTICK